MKQHLMFDVLCPPFFVAAQLVTYLPANGRQLVADSPLLERPNACGPSGLQPEGFSSFLFGGRFPFKPI